MAGERVVDSGCVGDWMSRSPMTVAESAPIGVAIARMQNAEVRHLLVMDGAVLTGIVSNRDLRRLVMRDTGLPSLSEPVRSIMSPGPVSVAPDTPMLVAARLLLEQRIGALPVREGDQIVGIFTLADALDALLTVVEGPRQ